MPDIGVNPRESWPRGQFLCSRCRAFCTVDLMGMAPAARSRAPAAEKLPANSFLTYDFFVGVLSFRVGCLWRPCCALLHIRVVPWRHVALRRAGHAMAKPSDLPPVNTGPWQGSVAGWRRAQGGR